LKDGGFWTHIEATEELWGQMWGGVKCRGCNKKFQLKLAKGEKEVFENERKRVAVCGKKKKGKERMAISRRSS